MVVMTLERVPARLHGYLARWLIEIQTGVYIGRVSASVRDLLWDKAIDLGSGGRVTQAWSSASEQGFDFRISGDDRRSIVDFDGFQLVAVRR